jgi:Co/Zn/Cd efflux system component
VSPVPLHNKDHRLGKSLGLEGDTCESSTDWIAKRGMRSTLLGILVNLGLSVTKISAGFVGRSFALVADGLESGADVLSALSSFSV